MEQLGKGLKASSAFIIVLLRKNNQCMRKAVVSHSSSRWESGFLTLQRSPLRRGGHRSPVWTEPSGHAAAIPTDRPLCKHNISCSSGARRFSLPSTTPTDIGDRTQSLSQSRTPWEVDCPDPRSLTFTMHLLLP